ncbi:MAG TPA: glycerophosphodiester phosphodiesterase [Chitinophagaceae bacterium]|nr:glycerophosphodiester phosphodiesterase [Chitinophagaceae bacterium]
MRPAFIIPVLLLLFYSSCRKKYEAPVPDVNNWAMFEGAGKLSLSTTGRNALEGVYTMQEGAANFGDSVAVKWNYTHKGTDTTWHLSIFCGQDVAYLITEGKKLNGDILLNGYWRKMAGVETGIVRLTIKAQNGADLINTANPLLTAGAITISGVYGNGQEEPTIPIGLTYKRKLFNAYPFEILAHRSGGRTSDLLPASENSVEMIRKTPEFGSTGIEIDVRLTSDGIPILYHDNAINLRETQKSGLVGPIENYSFDQLSTFVRLINGEKIPTLRQALDAVVYETGLRFVWLDTKYTSGSLQIVRNIQKEYLQKAAAAGRQLSIVIGLPTTDAMDEFLALPDFASAPNLCELTLEDVEKTNAEIWAPRFTLGTQNDDVAKVHAAGRKAFVWTLDVPDLVQQYLREGHFDAILSNYPSMIAYYYYVQP